MALGKPVIGGNTGGIPEVIKDGRNGVLVEPNAERIAEAILYLYENEDLRRKMSEDNLQDVTEFDWDRIVELYVNLYGEATGHRA